MSSNAGRPTGPIEEASSPARRRILGNVAEQLLWWPLLSGASLVWFFFGWRLMSRFGPDALGPAAGIMAAVAVGVTLWFLAIRDSRRDRVEAGMCPRCGAAIEVFEELPRPGALDRGLRGWQCSRCHLQEVGPLTSVRDAS